MSVHVHANVHTCECASFKPPTTTTTSPRCCTRRVQQHFRTPVETGPLQVCACALTCCLLRRQCGVAQREPCGQVLPLHRQRRRTQPFPFELSLNWDAVHDLQRIVHPVLQCSPAHLASASTHLPSCSLPAPPPQGVPLLVGLELGIAILPALFIFLICRRAMMHKCTAPHP